LFGQELIPLFLDIQSAFDDSDQALQSEVEQVSVSSGSSSSSSSFFKLQSSSGELEQDQADVALSASRVAVQETIDRLQRLAATIRRSGAHHRQMRIDHFLEKTKNRQVHETIKTLARQKANYLFPDAKIFIRERIAESVAKRRSRFLYTTRHQQKRSTPKLPSPPKPPPPTFDEDDVLPIPNLPEPIVEQVPAPELPVVPAQTVGPSIFSATEVTKLDPIQLKPKRNERPETVISVYISQTDFPQPPRVPPGATSFECPYCFLEYPVEERRDSRWK
jgi:hypothetical protein